MNAIPLPARLLMSTAALALATACSSSPSADPPAPDAGAAGPTASSAPAMPAPSSPAEEKTSEKPAADPVITIVDFEYAMPPSVPAGAKVTVTNQDSEAHTVTVQGGGDARVVVQGGETATFTAPAQAGTYPVVCDFHGNMKAELVIT